MKSKSLRSHSMQASRMVAFGFVALGMEHLCDFLELLKHSSVGFDMTVLPACRLSDRSSPKDRDFRRAGLFRLVGSRSTCRSGQGVIAPCFAIAKARSRALRPGGGRRVVATDAADRAAQREAAATRAAAVSAGSFQSDRLVRAADARRLVESRGAERGCRGRAFQSSDLGRPTTSPHEAPEPTSCGTRWDLPAKASASR